MRGACRVAECIGMVKREREREREYTPLLTAGRDAGEQRVSSDAGSAMPGARCAGSAMLGARYGERDAGARCGERVAGRRLHVPPKLPGALGCARRTARPCECSTSCV